MVSHEHSYKLVSSVTIKRFVEKRSNCYFLHTDEFLIRKTYWMLQTEVTNVNKTVISCYTSLFCTIRCLQKFNKHCFELHLKWYGPNQIRNWTAIEVTRTRLKFIPASLEVQWTKLRSNFNFIWSDTDRSKTCVTTFRADYMTSDKNPCVSACLFIIPDIIIIPYIRKFIHWYRNLVAKRWTQEGKQIESTIYVFTLCKLCKEHAYIRCDYDLVTRFYELEWWHR